MPDKHRNSLTDGLTDYATGPYVLANFYIESFFCFRYYFLPRNAMLALYMP